jgi:electron transfer flavoprotein-quinone oxidoreductase
MAEKAGLRKPFEPANYAVAVKELHTLDERMIEDRFGLNAGEGAACLFMGAMTKGMFGGGFLYTNSDSLSLGVVLGIESLMKEEGKYQSHRIMEEFKARSEVQKWIRGAELKEYSAHVISEAGANGLSRLYTDGMLVVGDAAGFALNLGLTVRGMEFAIASGAMAAEVAHQALAKGDVSAGFLSSYEQKLKESFVLTDMETFRRSGEILENPRLFTVYPKFVCELAESLFTIGEEPKSALSRTGWEVAKKYLLKWEAFKDLLSLRKM